MDFRKVSNENCNIFVGIDQSMLHTGITIQTRDNIIYSGGFSSQKNLFFEERIMSIRDFILSNLSEYNREDVSIAIEGLAFNRSPSNNGAMLFGLFSVILISLMENGYSYMVVPPTTLKKFATGDGRADKDKMLEFTSEEAKESLHRLSQVNNKKKFEDIIDSYWLSRYRMEN